MTILIRNLARTTTEASLKAYFTPYGEVKECVIVMDPETKKSKGFGFVEMKSGKAEHLAIKQLNTKRFEGAVLRVKLAVDPDAPAEATLDVEND